MEESRHGEWSWFVSGRMHTTAISRLCKRAPIRYRKIVRYSTVETAGVKEPSMQQRATKSNGSVSSIHTAADAGEAMASVAEVRAVAGRGLEGDRYFKGAGTFSSEPKPGREVTLIESEALEAASAEAGFPIQPRDSRRNIVTRDVGLNDLVGREFWVGDVKLRGIELCEPCSHLAQLAGKSLLRSLVHRGGIRADIVGDGVIRVGDVVATRR